MTKISEFGIVYREFSLWIAYQEFLGRERRRGSVDLAMARKREIVKPHWTFQIR